LFPNRGGRVANRFDCASQLIFGHAKMPRPIFNVILTLDNDFTSVRTDFTDHFCTKNGDTETASCTNSLGPALALCVRH
jgi:hypothetical protein